VVEHELPAPGPEQNSEDQRRPSRSKIDVLVAPQCSTEALDVDVAKREVGEDERERYADSRKQPLPIPGGCIGVCHAIGGCHARGRRRAISARRRGNKAFAKLNSDTTARFATDRRSA
jgi:hypothetical protein